MVGVSPTTGSPKALRWAAEEARLRGTDVTAVLAWRPSRASAAAPAARPPATGPATDPAGAAERRLRGFVTAALGSCDGIECRAVRGTAATALLAAARDADLVVLGEVGPVGWPRCAPAWWHRRSCCAPGARSFRCPPRAERGHRAQRL